MAGIIIAVLVIVVGVLPSLTGNSWPGKVLIENLGILRPSRR